MVEEPLELLLTERFQRRTTTWLRAFSGVSLVAAVMGPFFGDKSRLFAQLLPFIHCPLFWLAIIIRTLPDLAKSYTTPSSQYIQDKYPEIWKKLHPWGPG